MKNKFVALNTHFVGLVGAGVGFLGAIASFLNANPQVGLSLLGLFPSGERPLIASVVTAIGLGLAYAGRPKFVKPSDKVQVDEAAAEGAPHPVTLAKP
jgi:hypothetical protein